MHYKNRAVFSSYKDKAPAIAGALLYPQESKRTASITIKGYHRENSKI